MSKEVVPFQPLFTEILRQLARGRPVAITGLSNSGKSTLMRALASPLAGERYQRARGQPGWLVYVDCNQAVAISAQAFYEVVLRSLLDYLDGPAEGGLREALRGHHRAVTEADNAFTSSLAFNLALTGLLEASEADLVLILDEFDELYAALDSRALLNLRALRDRFGQRLGYVVASVRTLPLLRGQEIEGEFAELFSHTTYSMPLLSDQEARAILEGLGLEGLTEERRNSCLWLAGGHPGLLIDVAQVIGKVPKGKLENPLALAAGEPQTRAECLKIWGQLTEEERDGLLILALEKESSLPPGLHQRLHKAGLLRQGEIFSPLFADFVARKGRSRAVAQQGVYLDTDSGDVWVDGARIPVLTDLEYRLLKLLYQRRDKLTDKYRIVTEVWGEQYLGEVDDARVEKLVSRLRGKIEPDPSNPRYLITQRGRGYKLLSRPAHP